MTHLTSAKVIVRHNPNCAFYGDRETERPLETKSKRCLCIKAILVYEGNGSGGNRRISAKTRSWAEAEQFMQQWRDDRDPVKVELKRLKMEKQRDSVRIEDAVVAYFADLKARNLDEGTIAMERSMFGEVDPETRLVVHNG